MLAFICGAGLGSAITSVITLEFCRRHRDRVDLETFDTILCGRKI